MGKKCVVGMALVASLCLGATAHAIPVVLTFEGVGNTIYGAPITRLGYDIGNLAGDEQHFHEIDSTAFPGFVLSNGTGVLYNDRNTRIGVTANAGSGFSTFFAGLVDLGSVGSGPEVGGGTTNVAVEGFLGGFSTGIINVPVNFVAYNTVSLAGLGLVDMLVFDGTDFGGGFGFDNLHLDDAAAVPEPTTLGLLGLGVAALARRRRQHRG